MEDYELNSVFERIKARITCPEILSNLAVPTRKIGRRTEFLCLNHSDRHFGSCVANNEYVHCFSCGWHTDAIGLVSKAIENGLVSGGSEPSTFKAAVNILCLWTGETIDWSNKNSNKTTEPPFVMTEEELRLLGIEQQKLLRDLYKDSRSDFFTFLDDCLECTEQNVTLALMDEEYPEIKNVLEKHADTLKAIKKKINNGKENNKTDTLFFIKT